MNLPMHSGYEQLVAKAHQSHEQGRSSLDITGEDIDLARLYSYAFRMHTIGAFHATRLALEALEIGDALTKAHLIRATEGLETRRPPWLTLYTAYRKGHERRRALTIRLWAPRGARHGR